MENVVMFKQFKFEESLYQDLARIPLSTRCKLEGLGLEMPQEAWARLPLAERWVFCHLPIRSKGERECYAHYWAHILKREGLPSPGKVPQASGKKPWEDISRVPTEVAQKTRELNLPLFWPEWIKLDDLERYAIYKLCQDQPDPSLIRQAVQELLGVPAAVAQER